MFTTLHPENIGLYPIMGLWFTATYLLRFKNTYIKFGKSRLFPAHTADFTGPLP